jgi:hypothetical protein
VQSNSSSTSSLPRQIGRAWNRNQDGGATLASSRYHFSPLFFVREIKKMVGERRRRGPSRLARARSGRRLAILSGFGGLAMVADTHASGRCWCIRTHGDGGRRLRARMGMVVGGSLQDVVLREDADTSWI